jgi:hypothetical protein
LDDLPKNKRNLFYFQSLFGILAKMKYFQVERLSEYRSDSGGLLGLLRVVANVQYDLIQTL